MTCPEAGEFVEWAKRGELTGRFLFPKEQTILTESMTDLLYQIETQA
jgi:hypothetical protein